MRGVGQDDKDKLDAKPELVVFVASLERNLTSYVNMSK